MRALRAIGRQEDKINIKKTNKRRRSGGCRRGKLNIVGIGPGDINQMSRAALAAVAVSDVLVGYSLYIRFLGDMASGKETISSGMRQEAERARIAIKKAREGKTVSVISGGDSGVYGMAGVILEFLGKDGAKDLDIEIIPGITSAMACAALLGAPLMNDFAVISLSDILTRRRVIEKRLSAAARADFVIVLYNPKSISRPDFFLKALNIIKKYRAAGTPAGITKNAYRKGEIIKIVRLKEVSGFKGIDMATTVIIGNSATRVKNGYMVTSRGYDFKK